MLEQIKTKLQDEQVQRALLNGTGMVVTFVATQVFAAYFSKGVEAGIDKLMEKMHPTVETPAE